MVEERYSHDAFLGGRFVLRQERGGYRCGSDAILLAAATPPEAVDVVDLGCGPGAVGFAVAAALPAARVTVVDREPAMLELCRASLDLAENAALAPRIALVRGDVERPLSTWAPPPARESAEIVLTNPPFFDAERVRASPHAGRGAARTLGRAGLVPWVRAAASLLRPGGLLAAIVQAEMLPAMLSALSRGFGNVTIYPVRARARDPATRVIVAARKGSRAPLRLLAGIAMHGSGHAYGAAAEAVLRAAERLPDFEA